MGRLSPRRLVFVYLCDVMLDVQTGGGRERHLRSDGVRVVRGGRDSRSVTGESRTLHGSRKGSREKRVRIRMSLTPESTL